MMKKTRKRDPIHEVELDDRLLHKLAKMGGEDTAVNLMKALQKPPKLEEGALTVDCNAIGPFLVENAEWAETLQRCASRRLIRVVAGNPSDQRGRFTVALTKSGLDQVCRSSQEAGRGIGVQIVIHDDAYALSIGDLPLEVPAGLQPILAYLVGLLAGGRRLPDKVEIAPLSRRKKEAGKSPCVSAETMRGLAFEFRKGLHALWPEERATIRNAVRTEKGVIKIDTTLLNLMNRTEKLSPIRTMESKDLEAADQRRRQGYRRAGKPPEDQEDDE